MWANWKNYVLETEDKSNIRIILLLTSWGTGSSAVAGFLDKCGCYTCPPHFMETKDPKTPNTYEPSVYREILSSTIDEATFQQKSPMTIFSRKFSKFLDLERRNALENKKQVIVLKHPLQSFLLPEIEMIASPKYLILTRPYSLIEKTRRRRRWPPEYGYEGAKLIYEKIFAFAQNFNKDAPIIPFQKFREDREFREKILNYIEISPSIEQLKDAENFLR